MIVALEGLPGAGKTTSARLLAGRLGVEPLIEATDKHPFLDAVYEEEGRHDLQVELAFLVMHFAGWRKVSHDRAVVADFSPGKDLLFALDMLAGPDFDVFEVVFRRLYDRRHRLPDLVLVLDVPPAECLKRVRRRGRNFEQGVTLERLERMHRLYMERSHLLGNDVRRVPLKPGSGPDEVVDRLVAELPVAMARVSAARPGTGRTASANPGTRA